MESKLILYNGPTSPFGRKTKIISLIQEIDLEEKIINVYEADFLDKYNPCRKIPTLIGDGFTIIDSDNICLYFDSISSKQSIFPQNEYWKIMTYTSIANDLMETVDFWIQNGAEIDPFICTPYVGSPIFYDNKDSY